MENGEPHHVLLSYRRDDTAAETGRLYDDLVDRLGASQVFMDIDTIPPGADFVQALEDAVSSSDVVLVMIGRKWANPTGRRRLNDPNDFVRLEVAAALEREIRVIPVLLQGAVMPRTDMLPEALSKLVRRQAVELRTTRWRADVEQLVALLQGIPSRPPLAVRPHEGVETAVGSREASETVQPGSGQAPDAIGEVRSISGVSDLGTPPTGARDPSATRWSPPMFHNEPATLIKRTTADPARSGTAGQSVRRIAKISLATILSLLFVFALFTFLTYTIVRPMMGASINELQRQSTADNVSFVIALLVVSGLWVGWYYRRRH